MSHPVRQLGESRRPLTFAFPEQGRDQETSEDPHSGLDLDQRVAMDTVLTGPAAPLASCALYSSSTEGLVAPPPFVL